MHAWRETGQSHVCAREIERVALARVKRRVLRGLQVLDALYVVEPFDIRLIGRSRDRETSDLPVTCGLEQQLGQGRLPIFGIGAELAEVPTLDRGLGRMLIGLDGAIQGPRAGRAVMIFQGLQYRAAGEREIEVITRNQAR